MNMKMTMMTMMTTMTMMIMMTMVLTKAEYLQARGRVLHHIGISG